MNCLLVSLFIPGLLLGAGCCCVTRCSNLSWSAPGSDSFLSATNGQPWQTVLVQPRPDLPRIAWYDKLNPVWWFGNIDDPEPPEWYRRGEPRRRLKWYLRHPHHNFDNYVMGISDRISVRTGRYPRNVLNPRGGWNVCVSRYGCLGLPFLSYKQGAFEFYFGWRISGDFGIALRRNKPPVKT